MASPLLAELAPRESVLASAKPSWAEDRSGLPDAVLGTKVPIPFPVPGGGSVPQTYSPRQCWLSGSHS